MFNFYALCATKCVVTIIILMALKANKVTWKHVKYKVTEAVKWKQRPAEEQASAGSHRGEKYKKKVVKE